MPTPKSAVFALRLDCDVLRTVSRWLERKLRYQHFEERCWGDALHWKNGDSDPGIWLARCLRALAFSSRGSLLRGPSCPGTSVGVTVVDDVWAPLAAIAGSLGDGRPGDWNEDNIELPSGSVSFSGASAFKRTFSHIQALCNRPRSGRISEAPVPMRV
jgi:hypothetical protein